MIPFNKPYYSGKELSHISRVMNSYVLTGDTDVLRSCENFLEKKYSFKKVFLTNSCTIALEMSALLLDIKPGDEVIMPAYTFVSTANAFALRGAAIVFADSRKDHPGMDEALIESLITKKTKAIVVVHYAGIACNMDLICKIAGKHRLFVVEDAAQCIDSYYKKKALGSLGSIACFSFHETKNIHCGEGGFISINDPTLIEKAEILRNKGTNRTAFLKGEVNRYEWMGLGLSAVPSSISAAFLLPQLQKIDAIQKKRKSLWTRYFERLQPLSHQGIGLPVLPVYSSNNAHLFYLVCKSEQERNDLIAFLKENGVQAVFHYQSLQSSPFYMKSGHHSDPMAIRYSKCLLRLPLFYELKLSEVNYICKKVIAFYNKK